jgi:multidrug efflux pump subunit AcrA (membrane-fusion protein)
MLRRLTWRWAAVLGIALVVLVAAAIRLSPLGAAMLSGTDPAPEPGSTAALTEQATGESSMSATPAPTSRPAGRETVAVRRGTIAELLPLSGRVAALDETAVKFPLPGRIDGVLVKAGDAVEQGQLLLQADSKEIQSDLASARSRVELGSVRLEQAKAQAQARQRQAEQQTVADRARRQKAVQDAEIGLRRAQDDLTRVKAGAPAPERRAAEAAVVSARSAVERAEAELARASAGATEAELKLADQQVWAARLTLQRAENDLERMRQGPDPTQLSAAEREVSTAQATLLRARLDFERVTRGDPTAISAAQRDVQRAELALRTLQATRTESGGSSSARRNAQLAREQSIASARLTLQEAQERLNLAQRPPPAGEVEIARRGMQSAESALRTAQERYEVVKKGADELTLAAANQTVDGARSAALAAERRYLDLSAGPPPQQVAAAQENVRVARATLTEAGIRLAELSNRPTRSELQDSQDRVDVATAALEQARADLEAEPAPDVTDPASFDLLVLERNLDQDRTQVQTLERDLAATNLVAPTSGIVSAVLVHPGDPVDRDTHVLSIARAGDPIVTVDVGADDAGRIAAGQQAVVTIEGAPGQQHDARIIDLLAGPGGIGSVARLDVTWNATPPLFGLATQAVVTTREKSDVLLVPQRAIRSAGPRRYVEYMDGELRRTADITTGISGALDVEVVSGLQEGQVILAGTAGSAGAAPTPSPASGAAAP